VTNYSAYAYSIAVDKRGMSSRQFHERRITDGEFITLKYDSAGDFQWSARYKRQAPARLLCKLRRVDAREFLHNRVERRSKPICTIIPPSIQPEGDELWEKV